jgi:hypothetical protein
LFISQVQHATPSLSAVFCAALNVAVRAAPQRLTEDPVCVRRDTFAGGETA